MINEVLNNIKNELLKNNGSSNSILSGNSGICLFWYHYNLYKKNEDSFGVFQNSLEEVFDSFNLNQEILTYSNGTIGVLFLLEFFKKKGVIDSEIIEQDIYDEINKYAVYELDNNNYDILHGGLGTLMPTNLANKTDKKLVDLLFKKINSNDNLFLWNDFFTEQIHFNLGLAHGNPGYLAILVQNKFFLTPSNFKKVEKIIKSIKSFKIENATLSLYPNYSSNQNSSRLGWCYGDLGIASAFWQAGKAFNEDAWQQESIDIMLHSAKRKNLTENGVLDAGICHGAAGIAHFFNRFYKETGIKEFDEARWYWLDETLKMAKHNDGLAGYKSWHGDNKEWINDYSLLEGIAGIGLVLLGFLTDDVEDLDWDRCLLLS